MTQLIAIECSTDRASVALLRDDRLYERRFEAGVRQSEQLLVRIREVMDEADASSDRIDAVAVGIGPGAFTGVRLAIAAAQGLALAWNRLVVPISTLTALASHVASNSIDVPRGAAVLALLDARMNEVYAGWYSVQADNVTVIAEETVSPPGQLMRPPGVSTYIVVGNGFSAYEADVVAVLGHPAATYSEAIPSAGQVARLAARKWPSAALPPERVEAAYLRNKVALTSAERAAATD